MGKEGTDLGWGERRMGRVGSGKAGRGRGEGWIKRPWTKTMAVG